MTIRIVNFIEATAYCYSYPLLTGMRSFYRVYIVYIYIYTHPHIYGHVNGIISISCNEMTMN